MIDLFDLPASPLANCFSGKSERPELLILSGPSGAGKSIWCQRFGDRARGAGAIIVGFVSPAVMVEGRKAGIDLVDQLSGERRRLAVQRSQIEAKGTRTANWCLDEQVLSWANEILADLPRCDCLILDELGPLEFLQGHGVQKGLALVDSREAPLTVVVIRLSLLPLAKARWPWGQVVSLSDGEITCGDAAQIVGIQEAFK